MSNDEIGIMRLAEIRKMLKRAGYHHLIKRSAEIRRAANRNKLHWNAFGLRTLDESKLTAGAERWLR